MAPNEEEPDRSSVDSNQPGGSNDCNSDSVTPPNETAPPTSCKDTPSSDCKAVEVNMGRARKRRGSSKSISFTPTPKNSLRVS